MEQPIQQSTTPKLYTCYIRCYICTTILLVLKHKQMRPGECIDIPKCPDHDAGFYFEWEPE